MMDLTFWRSRAGVGWSKEEVDQTYVGWNWKKEHLKYKS
jgi:hypothetical protein